MLFISKFSDDTNKLFYMVKDTSTTVCEIRKMSDEDISLQSFLDPASITSTIQHRSNSLLFDQFCWHI